MKTEPAPTSACASCETASAACEPLCTECGSETRPQPFSVPHGRGTLSLSEPKAVLRYAEFCEAAQSLREAGYHLTTRMKDTSGLAVLPYARLHGISSLQGFRRLHEHLTGKKTVAYVRIGRKALSSGFFAAGCHFEYDAKTRKTTFKPEGGVVALKYRPAETPDEGRQPAGKQACPAA